MTDNLYNNFDAYLQQEKPNKAEKADKVFARIAELLYIKVIDSSC